MLQQFKDHQSWVQPARRNTRQQEKCILWNIKPDNPSKVAKSMTIFRVQPAGRNTKREFSSHAPKVRAARRLVSVHQNWGLVSGPLQQLCRRHRIKDAAHMAQRPRED